MTDPALKTHLYSEAERTVQELLNRGIISPQGHADIMRILQTEKNGSQNSTANFNQNQYNQPYQQSYPAPQTGYNNYQPAQGIPYNQSYPPQQGGYMAPVTMGPQQSMPPPQPTKQESQPLPPPAAAQPAPQAEHSSSGLGKFGKRMGNNVVNSMSHGFGFTIGADAANSLWHKF